MPTMMGTGPDQIRELGTEFRHLMMVARTELLEVPALPLRDYINRNLELGARTGVGGQAQALQSGTWVP